MSITTQALSGFTVSPFTRDGNRSTLLIFQFTAPTNLPSGAWQVNPLTPSSSIILQFYTKNAGGDSLFPVDLGTGLLSGANLPCYGIQNFPRKLI